MIDFLDVCKHYGGTPIFDHASFRINTGDRVGIVGPNGAGKSTLLGMLIGDVLPDKGSVNLPKNCRLGYLRQQLPASENMERTLLDYTADAIEEVNIMSAELHKLEDRLHAENLDEQERKSLLARHGHLQSSLEQLGGYRLRSAAEATLCNLGFKPEALSQPLSSFSGGWQMRASLARVLIAEPDLLLLDEPSNYLDIPAVEYLCRILRGFKGTLLLISHDRFLLRRLANVTLEVNGGAITHYPGNYDYYRTERENKRLRLESEKRNSDRKKEHLERLVDRFKAKSSKATQAKSWQKSLDKMDEVKLLDNLGFSGAIRFPEPPPCGTPVAEFEGVSFHYPEQKKLLDRVELRIENGDKIAFVGYNGTGKTTLLKLLVGKLEANEGKIRYGHHVKVGYQAQEFSDILAPEESVFDAVRGALPAGASQSELLHILGSFGFSGDATSKACKVLSGGEKIRLCFARIFVNPPNLLILDEPTTHLDINARELLQNAIKNYPGTVCMVSHDIEFIRNTASTVVAMEESGPRKYFGNYDYFLEKSAALNAANAPVEKRENSSVDLSKERRRERAQKRNELAGEKRRLTKLVADCEAKLEAQESRQEELVAMLSSTEKVDFAQVNRELAQLQSAIETTMTNWEEAAAQLEEVLKLNAQIHE